MRQLYKLLALLAVVALTSACYEDKGNYEYKDINEIVITMDVDHKTITIGETLEFNPTIKFVNGKGDISRFDFKWILIPDYNMPDKPTYTQDDWNTLDFKWTPDRLVPNGNLRLEATDRETGIIYFCIASCQVESRYSAFGAMILAEKEGVTQFSFIKVTESDEDNVPKTFVVYNNAYYTENGSNLPSGSIKIHEHFCSDNSTTGQLLLLTKNGAYDMDGKGFKKEIELAEAFENKTYPAGFNYAQDALFMSGINVVTDSEGHLYTRIKNTFELFHSGYFLHEKLRVTGETEDLKGCKLILAPFINQKACLVYEEPKKRFLLIADTNTGKFDGPVAENAGRPVLLGTPESAPEGFLPLNKLDEDAKIISIDYFRGTWNNIGYTIIFQRNGKTFCQEFEIEKDYSSLTYDVVSPTIYEINGLPGEPTYAHSSSYPAYNPLIYCAVGNQLFVYDRSNPTSSVVEYIPKDSEGNATDVLTGDIVAINSENYYSRWAAVGLSDGRVLLLRFIQGNYPVDQKLLYDSGVGVYGEITDVRCKIQGGNGWQVND